MAKGTRKTDPTIEMNNETQAGLLVSFFLSFFFSFFLSLFSQDKKNSKESKVTVMNRTHCNANAMQSNATWMDEEGEECH